MLKLCKKIVILFSPLIFLFFLFELNLAKIPTSYSLKKNYLEKNSSKIEALIMGSSHSLCAVNPKFLSRESFNAANSSQSLFYDFKIFEKYVNKMENLKVLIIPISYFSFEYDFSTPEAWKEYFYKRVYGFKQKDKILETRNFSYLALYGQLRSSVYFLNGFNVNLAKNIDEKGFQASDYGNILPDNGKKDVYFHNSIMDKSNIKKNIQYVEKMIEISKSRGIDPVIVTFPVMDSYSANIDKNRYNEMQEIIKKLSDKYKIKYYNYFFDKRFYNEDFLNSNHLNSLGAEKFTKILDKDVMADE